MCYKYNVFVESDVYDFSYEVDRFFLFVDFILFMWEFELKN